MCCRGYQWAPKHSYSRKALSSEGDIFDVARAVRWRKNSQGLRNTRRPSSGATQKNPFFLAQGRLPIRDQSSMWSTAYLAPANTCNMRLYTRRETHETMGMEQSWRNHRNQKNIDCSARLVLQARMHLYIHHHIYWCIWKHWLETYAYFCKSVLMVRPFCHSLNYYLSCCMCAFLRLKLDHQ